MKNKIEVIIHIVFWVFILALVNIDWNTNWFDQDIRPNTPAPLSLIMFAAYFYVNAFFLIPKYFSLESWMKYILYAALVFFLPELIRIIAYKSIVVDHSFEQELFSRDSFIFGAPSALFLAIAPSFLYRLIKDRFIHKQKIQELEQAAIPKKKAVPYEGQALLSEGESSLLKEAILEELSVKEAFLDPNYSLRKLATSVSSTEKKVSYLINQHLDTNFFELINKYRVEKFKIEIAKPENKHLSITGVASNCGFSSKSSFYRAFKASTGKSPSEYLKEKNSDH